MASWTGGTGAGSRPSLSRNSNESRSRSQIRTNPRSGGGGTSSPQETPSPVSTQPGIVSALQAKGVLRPTRPAFLTPVDASSRRGSRRSSRPPQNVVRDTSGSSLREVQPGLYMSPSGELIPTTSRGGWGAATERRARSQFARDQAMAGTANFQTATGEVQDVQYGGGASFERQNFTPRPRDYTPAYGYSTPQGETTISYAQVQPSALPPGMRRRLGSTNYYRRNTPFAPYVRKTGFFLEEAGGQGQRLFTEQQSRSQAFPMPSFFIPGVTKPTTSRDVLGGLSNTFGGVKGLGQRLRIAPDDTIAEGVVSYYSGQGIGRVSGMGVNRIAARWGSTTASGTQGALAVIGTGYAGYQVSTKTPEQLGGQAFNYAAGGAGFMRGYRSVVPPNSVRFNGLSGTRGELRVKGNTLGGFGTGKVRATISEFGNVRSQDVSVNYLVSGGKAQSGRFLVNVETQGYLRVGRKDVPFSQDFTGTLNPRRGLASFTDRQGTYFFSSTGKTTNRYGLPTRRTSYAVVQENQYGLPTVKETGRGVQGVDTINYLGYRPSSVKSQNIDLFSMGRPSRAVFEEFGGVSRGGRSGGTTSRLFDGFKDLQQAGYFTPKELPAVRTPLRVTGLGRRGSTMSRFRTDTFTKPFSTGKLRGGNQYGLSVEGLPFRGIALPGRAPLVGFGALTGAQTLSFLRTNTRTDRAPRSDQRTSPFSTTIPFTGTGTSYRSTTRTAPVTDFFPPSQSTGPGTPTTPRNQPGFPGIGGLPFLFAVPPGMGGTGKSGKGRKFKYAPDITSLLFSIRGKEKKGLLSGFEQRPVAL